MKPTVLLLIIVFSTLTSSAQGDERLQKILDGARDRALAYSAGFKDLIADETKTFEKIDSSGRAKKRKTVRSELLIYGQTKSAGSAELRIVNEINGKSVPDARRRSEKLLEELAKQKTSLAELNRLQRESVRYDDSFAIYGVTLNQATVLSRDVRGAFRFDLDDEALIGNRKVFVVRYLQINPSRFIAFNPAVNGNYYVIINVTVPSGYSPADLRLRGTLWIDAETLQLRREERDVVIAKDVSVPLITSRHEYSESQFGILVPSTIYFSINDVETKKGALVLESRQTALFTYSNFRKTNVEITLSDDDS